MSLSSCYPTVILLLSYGEISAGVRAGFDKAPRGNGKKCIFRVKKQEKYHTLLCMSFFFCNFAPKLEK